MIHRLKAMVEEAYAAIRYSSGGLNYGMNETRAVAVDQVRLELQSDLEAAIQGMATGGGELTPLLGKMAAATAVLTLFNSIYRA